MKPLQMPCLVIVNECGDMRLAPRICRACPFRRWLQVQERAVPLVTDPVYVYTPLSPFRAYLWTVSSRCMPVSMQRNVTLHIFPCIGP